MAIFNRDAEPGNDAQPGEPVLPKPLKEPKPARAERAPKEPRAPKAPREPALPRPPKAPKADKRGIRIDEQPADGEDTPKRSWRPAFLQFEKNNKKGEVAEAVRSLGIMLTTSRGETVPLATLAEQYKGTVLGNAFARIYQSVQSGQYNLAEAFAAEKVFPKIVADLLVVGTRSGSSAVNLQKAADIIDEGMDLQQKIKQAVMQPLILLVVIILFLYAVILFVLPVFADMFASFGKPLPPLSQAIMVAGNAIAWGGGGVMLIGLGWAIYYKYWGKNILALRIWMGRMQLKLPVMGPVFKAQRLTQVFSILSGLLSVGMSERDALLTAAEASGNFAVRDHLQRHIVQMDRGTVDFADLADGDMFPLQAGFMLRNGFDSGASVKALEDLTRVYQRDAAKRTDNLTTALEPIANGVVGVVFALVLVSVYLPVYEMFVGLTEVA
jgi:type IV pilus assembly protein PilC